MIIDTHVHFWKYLRSRDTWITDEMKALQQDFLPEHFGPIAQRHAIKGIVAVQVEQSEVETRFLLELAATHPIIQGIVGWVDLRSPDLQSRLEYFTQFPLIKGWRHIVQSEPDDFLLQKDFQQGVRRLASYGYSYDILIYHHQLPAALAFVDALPAQPLIIDHCAKPDLKHKSITEWKKYFHALAKYPHLHCKLSGLLTEANWKEWTPQEFYPYLDVVLETFGVDRILYGSDWPVVLLSGSYVQWKSLLEKYLEKLSPEDQEKIWFSNARRFYRL